MSVEEILRRQARRAVLLALAGEPGGTLNAAVLGDHLAALGISRSTAWVLAEIDRLEAAGAVDVRRDHCVAVATLAQRGAEHAEGRLVIDGVAPVGPVAVVPLPKPPCDASYT